MPVGEGRPQTPGAWVPLPVSPGQTLKYPYERRYTRHVAARNKQKKAKVMSLSVLMNA